LVDAQAEETNGVEENQEQFSFARAQVVSHIDLELPGNVDIDEETLNMAWEEISQGRRVTKSADLLDFNPPGVEDKDLDE